MIIFPQQIVAKLLLVLSLALSVSSWAQERPEYRLGPGDIIRISVFQSPDLTLETRVTENGTISFPLIGVVKVGGLTVSAAEQAIANVLRAGGYIQQPQVSILVLDNRSMQVSVLGQVNRPGRFPLETLGIRVSELIAIAGGITNNGADMAIVTGTRGGKPFRKEIELSAMFLSDTPDEDISVSAGDVIYVHRMPVYYIYGEVQRPSSYRVEHGMTIRQALAQGGGPTLRGTERALRVFRRGADGTTQTLTADLNELVQPNDVLYVRESLF